MFRRPRRCSHSLLAAASALVLWSTLADAEEQTGDDAIKQLSQTLYVHSISADGAGPALFRSLYWLRMATTLNDLSPSTALRAAYRLSQEPSRPLPPRTVMSRSSPDQVPGEEQYLADWHIASVYGLFTPENLALMQAGLAPVASDGPFVGQVIEAKKIRPNTRYPSTAEVALGPEKSPLPKDALPIIRPHNLPTSAPVDLASLAPPTPPPRSTPPFPADRDAALRQIYQPRLAAGRATPMPNALQPSAPMTVPAGPAAPGAVKEPPRVVLQDLPFNALLPTDGKIKIGIAGVTSGEISVAIVGDRTVTVGYNTGNTLLNPSIEKYKVPKINPIRLPGVSSNSYLIRDEPAGKSSAEVRYYFVDTTLDNGTTFRIAKVVGEL